MQKEYFQKIRSLNDITVNSEDRSSSEKKVFFKFFLTTFLVTVITTSFLAIAAATAPDTAPPIDPTPFSTSHTVDQLSNDNTIDISLSGATDDTGLDPIESRITTNGSDQSSPVIYGDKIVWEDYRNGNYDIYVYDLTTLTESQITTNGSHQYYPAIYGDKIVWQDGRNGNYDIYMYDLTASTESQITTNGSEQYSPAIYGDKIVWEDYRNGNADIYMYDLTSSMESQITSLSSNQLDTSIYGNKIVWHDYRNINWDIYMYDLTASTESQITTSNNHQLRPAIYSDKIVWEDYRNGLADIYMYDLTASTESRITTNGSDQKYPAIYSDKIVWEDYRNGNYDIYMYNLTTLTESQITTNGSHQYYPAIYGDKIVEQDGRDGGHSDIYMYSLGGGGTPSGVDGFSYSFTEGAASSQDVPDATKDIEESVSSVTSAALSDGTYFFHIRTVDNAGNWTSTAHSGPYLIVSPSKTRYEETSGQIAYKASCWNNYSNAALSGGAAKISKNKSCTAIFSYTGSKVEFISAKAKQLGKTKIYIDNVLQTTLDLYSSSTLAQQAVYSKTHGSSGAHTLKVEVLATKNTKASGYFIPIDAFDVTN